MYASVLWYTLVYTCTLFQICKHFHCGLNEYRSYQLNTEHCKLEQQAFVRESELKIAFKINGMKFCF